MATLTGVYVEYYHVDELGVRAPASGYRFVPSPMIEISRESYTTNGGLNIGGGYVISLEGSILPNTTTGEGDQTSRAKGGSITNVIETFKAENDLAKGLEKNGGILQGQFLFNDPTCDKVAFWSSGVVIDSLQFSSPSQWVTRVDYTAEIFCPNTFMTGTDGIGASAGNEATQWANPDYISGTLMSSTQEYNVEVFAKPQEVETATGVQRTPMWFSVGVSTSSQSMRGSESLGYNHLGIKIDRAINAFLNNSRSGALEYDELNPESGAISGVGETSIHTQRSLGINYAGGSTSWTDTFLGTSLAGPSGMLGTGLTSATGGVGGGAAIDTYDIKIDSSIDTAFVTVTVDGNIQGLEAYNAGGAAVKAANTYLNTILTPAAALDTSVGGAGDTKATGHTTIYERALSLYNTNSTTSSKVLALNTEPMSKSIGYVITYTNRPPNCCSGALSEVVNVSRDMATPVHSNLTILGRVNGPILQNIGTKTASTTSVNVESFVIPPTGTTVCSGDLLLGSPEACYEKLISGIEKKISGDFGSFFRTADGLSWDPRQGRYTRNVAWIHTDC